MSQHLAQRLQRLVGFLFRMAPPQRAAVAILCINVAILASCGGGSGSSGQTTSKSISTGTGTPTPPPTTTTNNTLTITITSGSGSVALSTGGFTCSSGTCVLTVPTGTTVSLLATPATGSVVSSWFGACAAAVNANACTVNVNADLTASISFVASYKLTVTTAGAGHGTVLSTPQGIACASGSTNGCSSDFVQGTQIQLTATTETGSVFSSWSGGGCAPANINCTINLQADTQVTASFATAATNLVDVSVAGGGTVTSTPSGVTCDKTGGAGCSVSFNSGSQVQLTATPNAGYSFSGWGGACSGNSTTCTFTKSGSIDDVSAFFVSNTPAAAPIVMYTDIASGPNTGGENGKGIYLSVFGKNFTGVLGTDIKVYINNIEVDNYRTFGASKGRSDVQQISVQIGPLGSGALSPALGTPLPVVVAIDGQTSNTDVSFIVNPGNIYFVDNSVGVDTTTTNTGGSFTSPFLTVQRPGVSNSTPIQAASVAGAYGRLQAGDFLVIRQGTGNYATIGFNNTFMTVQNKSGKAPTGAAGTGPITFMGYPGDNVFIDSVYNPNTYGGAISSADTQRQAEGFGAWVTIVDMRIEGGREEGVVNAQAGTLNPNGSHWRVVNNEMTAETAVNNVNAKAAGITGSGSGEIWMGNYIHDVYCGPDNGSSPLQNHGIYIDGDGDYIVRYNQIVNIFGGNGIQTFNNGSNGNDFLINTVIIDHNLIHNVRKHLMNIADGSADNFAIYDNVIYNSSLGGIRFNTTDLHGAKIWNNTIYNNNEDNNPNYGPLTNDATLAAGAVDVRNNIFVPASGTPYQSGTVGFFSNVGTFANNLYYHGSGSQPSGSTASVTGSPLFVSTTSGSEDLHIQAGSPAIGAGSSAVSGTVTTDFDLTTRSGYDIGAYQH